jgi:hypothetical protein
MQAKASGPVRPDIFWKTELSQNHQKSIPIYETISPVRIKLSLFTANALKVLKHSPELNTFRHYAKST